MGRQDFTVKTVYPGSERLKPRVFCRIRMWRRDSQIQRARKPGEWLFLDVWIVVRREGYAGKRSSTRWKSLRNRRLNEVTRRSMPTISCVRAVANSCWTDFRFRSSDCASLHAHERKACFSAAVYSIRNYNCAERPQYRHSRPFDLWRGPINGVSCCVGTRRPRFWRGLPKV